VDEIFERLNSIFGRSTKIELNSQKFKGEDFHQQSCFLEFDEGIFQDIIDYLWN
jgi:hypothetical protein